MTNYRVHETHCCILHGCKYGDSNCPVVLGLCNQAYLCELCDEDFKPNVRTVIHVSENQMKDLKNKKKFFICKKEDYELEDGQMIIFKLEDKICVKVLKKIFNGKDEGIGEDLMVLSF